MALTRAKLEELITKGNILAKENEGFGFAIPGEGILIDFGVLSSPIQNDWLRAEISGATDGYSPIFTQIQVNKYHTAWLNPYQRNYGLSFSAVKWMEYQGNLCAFIPSSTTIRIIGVRAYDLYGRISAPTVTSAASEPAGTNKVTCTVV